MCQASGCLSENPDQGVEAAAGSKLSCGDAVVQDSSLRHSVDLLFRFMSRVVERAKRISQSDDLMLDVLRPAPLSSIGMSENSVRRQPTDIYM
jgi:hypothetical protein